MARRIIPKKRAALPIPRGGRGPEPRRRSRSLRRAGMGRCVLSNPPPLGSAGSTLQAGAILPRDTPLAGCGRVLGQPERREESGNHETSEKCLNFDMWPGWSSLPPPNPLPPGEEENTDIRPFRRRFCRALIIPSPEKFAKKIFQRLDRLGRRSWVEAGQLKISGEIKFLPRRKVSIAN
jgi:hypothetical protein